MSVDLDRRIADLRGAPELSEARRAEILDTVLAADPAPHRGDLRVTSRTRRGPRARIVVAATGLVVAAACIALPAVLPSGTTGSADPAAAAALYSLARVAAVSPSDRLGANQYLHIVEVDRQGATPGQPAHGGRFETWIRRDGATWQQGNDEAHGGARADVWRWPAGPQPIDGMTPARQPLDRLPTSPVALERYVRAHTTGSTSTDERVFVAVVDIVRRGTAPARLRVAAIEVLARLAHVRLGDKRRDSLGRPVREFEFVDPSGRPDDVQTIMFDTRTAQITEEIEYFHGRVFVTRTIRTFEVVNAVPVDILRRAIPMK